jgi:hypothetical protein
MFEDIGKLYHGLHYYIYYLNMTTEKLNYQILRFLFNSLRSAYADRSFEI